jgi:quercetin dioxygenase-like cupin family protein
MPTFIQQPSIVQAAGNKPKIIEEYIGRVNSKTEGVSIARMKSPSGWVEPGQTPEFDEYTVVLRGTLRVTTQSGTRRRAAKGRSTSRSACRPSRWTRFIAMRNGA